MRVVALSPATGERKGLQGVGHARIGDREVGLGLVALSQPAFDPHDPALAGKVLVQVEAFSCNYRDKAICLNTHALLDAEKGPLVGFFGSEFAGIVVACGEGVTLSCGDRIVPDATYPFRDVPVVPGGIVTNRASRGWLVLDEAQLIRVPETMSPVVAAAFSLGAQTAQSMVRRSGVGPGDPVLVTSGRSNTSLFLARSLLALGARVHVSSSASGSADLLRELGDGVTYVPASETVSGHLPPMTAVFDPFFDLHVAWAVNLLDFGGRYVTCGLQGQHPAFALDGPEPALREVLGTTIVRNLSLIGNCIGGRADLERGLALHADGLLDVTVDSVWRPADAVGFVERTFTDRARLGKVVLDYR